MEEKLSFIEKHPRLVFWLRFTVWVLFGAILPFLFIALRFNIFKKASNFSLSGWGILGVIIVASFAITLIRYIRKGFSSKSVFATQCINGFCRVIIPLIALYGIIKINIENLELFLDALGCVIMCELIAIPLNPMPEWVEKCKKEKNTEDATDIFDVLSSRLKNKDKEK